MLGTEPARIPPDLPPIALVRDPDQAFALVQPERLRLLDALSQPDSAAGLARRLSLPRQRLNYHLKELERVGLLELVEERRRGNCLERVVRATARAYVISPEVLGSLGHTVDEARDKFSAWHLVQAAARSIKEISLLLARSAQSGKRLATLTLDVEIRFASPSTRAKFAQDLTAAVATLVEKYHDEHAPGGRTCRLVASAYPKPAGGVAPLDAKEQQL